jgi:hypothetical protein
MGPRGRDKAIVRVVGTEHGDLAAKRTARRLRQARRLIHDQGKDEIGRRAFLERTEGVLGRLLEGGRQFPVRMGFLAVFPNLDLLVELAEELERDARDLEFTEDVPCDECVKDLFCDVERREVLDLKPQSEQNTWVEVC